MLWHAGSAEEEREYLTVLVKAFSDLGFVVVPDPIGLGLVASLAHPGGNLTGLSVLSIDLSGKSLALLKEAAPGLTSVALFVDPQS